jgi:hypothetical protein
MKISRIVGLAAVALALASGAALAKSNVQWSRSGFSATPAQIAADLRNPNNTTYVPATSNGY